MGLMDRAMDKAMVKLDSRFGELKDILNQILQELRAMNERAGGGQ